MEFANKKYYLDSSFGKHSEEKWMHLLDSALIKADYVEFNVLSTAAKWPSEMENLKLDIVDSGEGKNKYYPSRKIIRFRLSEKIISFVRSKNFRDWYNYYLEDISFIKNGTEFLATITHENQVLYLITEKERVDLNNKGFVFDCEWNRKMISNS